jgi:hypothetical protein
VCARLNLDRVRSGGSRANLEATSRELEQPLPSLVGEYGSIGWQWLLARLRRAQSAASRPAYARKRSARRGRPPLFGDWFYDQESSQEVCDWDNTCPEVFRIDAYSLSPPIKIPRLDGVNLSFPPQG